MNLIHCSQLLSESGEFSNDSIEIGIDLQDFQQNHEWDIVNDFI